MTGSSEPLGCTTATPTRVELSASLVGHSAACVASTRSKHPSPVNVVGVETQPAPGPVRQTQVVGPMRHRIGGPHCYLHHRIEWHEHDHRRKNHPQCHLDRARAAGSGLDLGCGRCRRSRYSDLRLHRLGRKWSALWRPVACGRRRPSSGCSSATDWTARVLVLSRWFCRRHDYSVSFSSGLSSLGATQVPGTSAPLTFMSARSDCPRKRV